MTSKFISNFVGTLKRAMCGPRLSDAMEDYLVSCYAKAERTRAIYREHLNRLAVSLDDPPLRRITNRDIAQFMSGLRRQDGREYSSAYLHQAWRTFHTFFEFCIQESWLHTNPMKRVQKPELDEGPRPRLTLDQVEKLLNAARQTSQPERNSVIVLLMVDSGLRINEVTSLQASHIRLDDNTVYTRSAKTHRTRKAPLSETTVLAIQDYLAKRPPFQSSDAPFFEGRDGQPLTKNAVHEMLKRLEKQCGVRLHAHLLRHTFANLYIKVGDTGKLQKILGHSRIETTSRYYAQPEFSDIQKQHRFASPTAQLAYKKRGKKPSKGQ
jgi:site-specific recombinase XerD